MKILFVIENYPPHIGGVEALFKNLAEGLAKKHEVTIITHKPKKAPSKRDSERGEAYAE